MSLNVKISVIVPVYNSEEYLGRCIESILRQTYELFELIIVDDGSLDNSWKILKDYSRRDKRIKIIHQENAGPGIARNRGIEEATGEYVVFVDSDDFIDKDYFLKLSRKTEDLIFIDVNQVNESFELICTEYMSDKRGVSKDEFIRGQMTGKINWGGVRKAVKRELLEKYNIKYSDHKIGEEAIFSFLILYYATSFSFIEGAVYTYINREGSIGLQSLPNELKAEFRKRVSRFDYVSVREKQAQKILAELGIKSDVSPDPTLLLNKEEWNAIARETIKNPYILCYFVSYPKGIEKVVEEVQKKYGKKYSIVNLMTSEESSKIGDIKIRDAGPREFLGLFKNANYIITSSFHGTVFSIINRKPFVTTLYKSTSSRVVELLYSLSLEDRIISPTNYNVHTIFKEQIYDEEFEKRFAALKQVGNQTIKKILE